AQPVCSEQPSLPGAGPDDRVAHHRPRLDVLVRPDADVGVDDGAGADGDLAADDGAFLEQAAVLDGHGAADHGAAKAAVLADVAVVPDHGVGNFRVVVDCRVVADHAGPVEPDVVP